MTSPQKKPQDGPNTLLYVFAQVFVNLGICGFRYLWVPWHVPVTPLDFENPENYQRGSTWTKEKKVYHKDGKFSRTLRNVKMFQEQEMWNKPKCFSRRMWCRAALERIRALMCGLHASRQTFRAQFSVNFHCFDLVILRFSHRARPRVPVTGTH